MKLTNLSILKLKSKIDRFLYDFGFNVALDSAEKQKTFKQFIRDLKAALVWQIKEITKPENFERLMEVMKVEKLLVRDVGNKELFEILNTIFGELNMKQAFMYGTGNKLGFYFKWGADLGGQAAIDKLGIEGVFGVIDPVWLEYLNDLENLLIDSVDETTKRWIAAILQEGLENQLTDLEIRDLLMTEIKGISAMRAEMIARTEIANVMNKTELESYKRSGVEKKRWRTSRDERVCEICAPLDNEEVKVNQNFSSGDDAPPIHPNCRCFLQAVIDEWWEAGEKEVWLGD